MGIKALMLGALVAVLAACGGGGDDAATTTTTAPNRDLTVRVTAEKAGLGCSTSQTRSGLDVGNDARLRVTDGSGEVLGVGTFDLSPGLVKGVDICDWTAVVKDVDAEVPFVELDAGGPLATLSQDEIDAANGNVHINIDVTGTPTVEAD